MFCREKKSSLIVTAWFLLPFHDLICKYAINKNKDMNERKKSHISIYFTWIFSSSSSSGQQSHFPVQQPPSRLFLLPTSFLPLWLITPSFCLHHFHKPISMNSLLRESTNCFTPSLFRSHSLISLSKICSVSFKLCSFCFNKKVLYLLWVRATDLIKLGLMVTSHQLWVS